MEEANLPPSLDWQQQRFVFCDTRTTPAPTPGLDTLEDPRDSNYHRKKTPQGAAEIISVSLSVGQSVNEGLVVGPKA